MCYFTSHLQWQYKMVQSAFNPPHSDCWSWNDVHFYGSLVQLFSYNHGSSQFGGPSFPEMKM